MINRIGTILFFTVLFVPAIPALSQESPQLLFDRGNDALVAGEYRQALNAYHQLLESNQVSGAMYLNMGISYVRLDSLGKAKYYFLKAGIIVSLIFIHLNIITILLLLLLLMLMLSTIMTFPRTITMIITITIVITFIHIMSTIKHS